MTTDVAPKAAFGRMRFSQLDWTAASPASADSDFSGIGEYTASVESRSRLEHEPTPATIGYVLVIDEPTSAYSRSESDVERITLSAYLRAMWSILSSAFTHPLQTAVIDLNTGKVIERLSR